MSDLRDLYQEVILDHSRRPRNYRAGDPPCSSIEGYNPLCGDRLTVYLKVKDGVVQDASFQGTGCAISTASASLMTESVRGLAEKDVRTLFAAFQGVVTGKDLAGAQDVGKLTVLSGVRGYPVRVKCATLAWHTMMAALEGRGEPVTTE